MSLSVVLCSPAACNQRWRWDEGVRDSLQAPSQQASTHPGAVRLDPSGWPRTLALSGALLRFQSARNRRLPSSVECHQRWA